MDALVIDSGSIIDIVCVVGFLELVCKGWRAY